jgi:hypothetical protein
MAISKFGLLMVMVGFCMPIVYNMNGYQIGKYSAVFNGPAALSISLYAIFFIVWTLLLLLLVIKKPISLFWDWLAICGIIIFSFITYIKLQEFFTSLNSSMWQSGAYLILIGLIISISFLIIASILKSKSIKTY